MINKNPKEHDYIKNWAEFEFMPGIIDVVRELNKKFLVVVVSNQRGIVRGLMSEKDLEEIHKKMKEKFLEHGAKIDAIYFCPHDIEDNCSCRKPKPGMLLQVAKDLNIDLKNSYMIGDSISDIEAGKNAGCKAILLNNIDFAEKHKIKPDFLIKNISEIIKIIK